MVTTTTSPREARLPPSNVSSAPVPLVKAPPWIQNMTGFKLSVLLLEAMEFGKYGVQMLRNKQSSEPVDEP